MATYTEEDLNEVRRQTAAEMQILITGIDAKVASAVAAVAAERDAEIAKLAEIESELADPEVTIKKVRDAHERTVKQRERAKLQAKRAELETETAQVVAALDLLKDAKNK